jgi:hypothetical protein
MVALLGILGMVAMVVFSAIWHGYVFSVLWGWFAVPAFGLPALSLAMSIGIALLVNYATYHRVTVPENPDKSQQDKIVDSIAHIITYPLIVLFMGWVVKLYI